MLRREPFQLIGKAQQGGQIMGRSGEQHGSATPFRDGLERGWGVAGNQFLELVPNPAIAEFRPRQCPVQRV
jgi:hypothetical protein